jgi:hypothetical protein
VPSREMLISVLPTHLGEVLLTRSLKAAAVLLVAFGLDRLARWMVRRLVRSLQQQQVQQRLAPIRARTPRPCAAPSPSRPAPLPARRRDRRAGNPSGPGAGRRRSGPRRSWRRLQRKEARTLKPPPEGAQPRAGRRTARPAPACRSGRARPASVRPARRVRQRLVLPINPQGRFKLCASGWGHGRPWRSRFVVWRERPHSTRVESTPRRRRSERRIAGHVKGAQSRCGL